MNHGPMSPDRDGSLARAGSWTVIREPGLSGLSVLLDLETPTIEVEPPGWQSRSVCRGSASVANYFPTGVGGLRLQDPAARNGGSQKIWESSSDAPSGRLVHGFSWRLLVMGGGRVIIPIVRTPAGKECQYYYEDYFRGRETQECRLLSPAQAREWKPSICFRCPVPAILLANACPHLILSGEVRRGWFGLGARMRVSARCKLTARPVQEPHIGCGECHLYLPKFRLPPEDTDDLHSPI